jgi:hypothetical protein
MTRLLLLDGDVCLWNVLCEVLESEGYTLCLAHNDYEGLPPAPSGLMAPIAWSIQYVVLLV